MPTRFKTYPHGTSMAFTGSRRLQLDPNAKVVDPRRKRAEENYRRRPGFSELGPARRLLTALNREVLIARRTMFLTCSCGIFPKSRRSGRVRWPIWGARSARPR